MKNFIIVALSVLLALAVIAPTWFLMYGLISFGVVWTVGAVLVFSSYGEHRKKIKASDSVGIAADDEIGTKDISKEQFGEDSVPRISSDESRKERALLEHAVDVICVIDDTGRFVSVNPAVERSWGYKPDELIGKPLMELLDANQGDSTLESIIGAKHSIEKVAFENRILSKKGNCIDLAWTAHWSVGDGGLFCIARDVTEKKQFELKLRESEERNRLTLESMPTGIICTSLTGVIELANRNWLEMYGKPIEDILGQPIQSLFGSSGSQIYDLLVRAARTQEALVPIEATLKCANQADLHLEVSARTFKLSGAKKLLITLSDISQRKEIERLRAQFASMINHDLRTPLASLSGFVGLLKKGNYGQLNERGLEMSNIVEADLGRLMHLLTDLLDLEKIDSGAFSVSKDLVSVEDLFEASESSVRVQAEIRGIRIQYTETEQACLCDRLRIIQVLVNLLSNAIKFSPEGSIVKMVLAELDDTDGKKYLCISVEDSGRGVPAGKEDLMFQRFGQVDADSAVERSGSGLGLSICKAIVQAHGGKIGYRAGKPSGSIFWFTLPA